MNKLFYILYTIVLVGLFASCDPIQNDMGYGTVITSADQLQATVTNVMDGTKKTNKVIVHCTSPVNCQWTDGVNTSVGTDTTMILMKTGTLKVTLNTMTVDGTKLTRDYSVQVDEIKFPIAPQFEFFTALSSKTWTWTDAEKCFGNGGGGDTKPAWWTLTATDITGQCADKKLPAEGLGATMKFRLDNGLFLDKITADNKTTTGKFKFDMTAGKAGWSIGTLTVINTNILCGYDFNATGLTPWTTYNIISLDANKMVLGVQEHAPNSNYWYYVFKAL
jgi:hypothetical protein